MLEFVPGPPNLLTSLSVYSWARPCDFDPRSLLQPLTGPFSQCLFCVLLPRFDF